MSDSTVPSSRPLLPVLGWGAFVAASWTWCIGMFLPVLLVRQFSAWGWLVFAVPNILGAAAMGWVLPDPAASSRLVSKHYTACFFFSAVTIAFHLFFLGILWRMIGPAVLLLCLVGLIWAKTLSLPRGDWLAAALALLLSLAGFLYLLLADQLSWPTLSLSASPTDLGAVACVCAFGFLLCPYLDLTFHRARLHTPPRVGRAAFTFGFLVPFLLMILFTLGYARPLAGVVGTEVETTVAPVLLWIVAFHILLQSGLTLTLHAREVLFGARTPWTWPAVLFLLFSLAAGAAVVPARRFLNLDVAEIGYRLFLAFYGLVFPAYVWLCILPTRQLKTRPSRATLTVFFLAVLLAAPLFYLGFIAQRLIWIYPALAILLFARLFVRTSKPTRQSAVAARR